MTTATETTPTSERKASKSFGNRLKTAREALGLERKQVADQLRLNESIILMMEKERFRDDIPVPFIRGYIRAYSKFLQIPEFEIQRALEPIQAKPSNNTVPIGLRPAIVPMTSSNYLMQMFTYAIILTLIALFAWWWYAHPSAFHLNEPLNLLHPAQTNEISALPTPGPTNLAPIKAANPVPTATTTPTINPIEPNMQEVATKPKAVIKTKDVLNEDEFVDATS